MPIKGLTTRKDLTARLPRIGKLRKGGEREKRNKNGREYFTFGQELDHFRFTSDRPEIVAAFERAYGKEPRQINAYLPYATTEKCFQTWKEAWVESGLKHRCDGERTVIWQDDKGNFVTDPDKQITCPKGCDEVGYLELIIPELMQAGYVGTVTIETHSINDLIHISECLLKVEEMRGDDVYGLRGVGFVVRRVPQNISVPGFGDNKGKRQRVLKNLVMIEPAPDWVQLQMASLNRAAMTPPDELPQLMDGNGHDHYANMDASQVEALVRQAEILRELSGKTDADKVADFKRNVERQRGPANFKGYDDLPYMPPPPSDVTEGDYTTDAPQPGQQPEAPEPEPVPPVAPASDDQVSALIKAAYVCFGKTWKTSLATHLGDRYHVDDAHNLSSGQCDELIAVFDGLAQGKAV